MLILANPLPTPRPSAAPTGDLPAPSASCRNSRSRHPTLRRWGAKLAVAVDRPFFNAVGGTSDQPSHDLNEGDIIWLVTRLNRSHTGTWQLARDHWEVLTLEDSNKRLQAAETISRENFETALRSRLRPL